MRSMMLKRGVLSTVVIIAIGTATSAQAQDCSRYVGFDGTVTSVDMTCAQQLGIPPIFVRDSGDGYDIVVTNWSGASSTYSPLWPSSVQWLSSGTHLQAAEKVIDFAESNGDLWPLTSSGGEAKIEYVNYTLSSYLNNSGASTTIASTPNNAYDGSGCAYWSICSSCQTLACLVIGGWHTKCYCDNPGFDCCVIHRTMEVISD